MKFSLSNRILEKYPYTKIGIITAHISVKNDCDYTDKLQNTLKDNLQAMGLDVNNYSNHPNIILWRDIYQMDFGLNPKIYRSSIDALVRRVLMKNKLWNISNIVDLYNCCSVQNLLPMAAYDLDKIEGDIQIRYGRYNEVFQGIGQFDLQSVLANHIVYADNNKILCWLWNYKDSQLSCIDNKTKKAIFFIDSIGNSEHANLEKASKELSDHLIKINCQIDKVAVVDRDCPEIEV